jgi:hypothetical protein
MKGPNELTVEEKKKIYYILRGLEFSRHKMTEFESATMRHVQKVKFGHSNYSD